MLDLVSITGADDAVNITDLAELGAQFPFVEWALLYVPGKEGEPRNPLRSWRRAFFDAKVPGRNAVHLCGRLAFEELLSDRLPTEILQANRLQLNVNARRMDFTPEEVSRIYIKALDLGPDIILQFHEGSEDAISRTLPVASVKQSSKVHILLDGSRGKGVLPSAWAVPQSVAPFYCGFAGGLGPDTVAAVVPLLEAMGRRFWIDMETGIRTDNQFDLVKVRAVLESVNESIPA